MRFPQIIGSPGNGPDATEALGYCQAPCLELYVRRCLVLSKGNWHSLCPIASDNDSEKLFYPFGKITRLMCQQSRALKKVCSCRKCTCWVGGDDENTEAGPFCCQCLLMFRCCLMVQVVLRLVWIENHEDYQRTLLSVSVIAFPERIMSVFTQSNGLLS